MSLTRFCDTTRKATIKLNQAILEQLDTLQLQLELGNMNAPYKEVIVKEAISQLLEQMLQNRNLLVAKI